MSNSEKRERLHLGQRVWVGDERVEAVVEGITGTVVGLILVGGPFVFAGWDEIELG